MNYEEYCEKRDALGLTDHAIANYSKISKSTFSQWKNGKLKPSERTMNKLKFFFDNYDPEHYYKSAVDYFYEIEDEYLAEYCEYSGFEFLEDGTLFC